MTKTFLTNEDKAELEAKIGEGGGKNFYTSENYEYGYEQTTLQYETVIALYDELAAKYHDYVKKETVSTDDGSFANYAYTFSTGEYNSKGTRGELDTYIKKPKYLVLSGIHGREKTAVMSTYQFFRDLAEGKNLPADFREGAVFKVLPVGTPWSFNYEDQEKGGRTNENGVNINRNFDSNWQAGPLGFNYPGTHAGSEKETKVISKWLESNNDARLFIDFHNSSANEYKEVAMIVGSNNTNIKKAKQTALAGLDRIIPSWREKIKGEDKIYSYSSFTDPGGLCVYYAEKTVGVDSIVLECSTRQDDPNTSLTPVSIEVGAEALGNIILEFFQNRDNVNYGEAGQFAVADGKGGIKWLTAYTPEEVAY